MSQNNLSACTPAELIVARSDAFVRGDFGFIFDSYHSEANFRRQFATREDYLEFGRDSLGRDYRIISCQVLDEALAIDESRVLYLVAMSVRGELHLYAELAWLRRESGAWRYHRGQKMTAEELPKDPQKLRLEDFARLDGATIF